MRQSTRPASILFVVDTRGGLVPLDQEVAKRLRYVKVPMICVANKTDDSEARLPSRRILQLGRGKMRLHQHVAKPQSRHAARL